MEGQRCKLPSHHLDIQLTVMSKHHHIQCPSLLRGSSIVFVPCSRHQPLSTIYRICLSFVKQNSPFLFPSPSLNDSLVSSAGFQLALPPGCSSPISFPFPSNQFINNTEQPFRTNFGGAIHYLDSGCHPVRSVPIGRFPCLVESFVVFTMQGIS